MAAPPEVQFGWLVGWLVGCPLVDAYPLHAHYSVCVFVTVLVRVRFELEHFAVGSICPSTDYPDLFATPSSPPA
uniref:Putative secreted protein n=1 Tax=Anopheles darlingi TaxID=43151 RepID=A0A2M4D9B8_ANODA